MSEPDFMLSAYTDIGRAVFAWGRFEQAIIRQTWHARDPSRKSAFVIGPIETGFYKRWLEWCRIHEAPDSLQKDILKLSHLRDDLSHNVFDIFDLTHGRYGLGVERRMFDWRSSFRKWAERYAHLPPRARPNGPKEQVLLQYRPTDIQAFVAAVGEAHQAITALSEDFLRAHGYKSPSG
jgi:hypothetical protein